MYGASCSNAATLARDSASATSVCSAASISSGADEPTCVTSAPIRLVRAASDLQAANSAA